METICKKCNSPISGDKIVPKAIQYRQCRQIFSLNYVQTVSCPACGTKNTVDYREVSELRRKQGELSTGKKMRQLRPIGNESIKTEVQEVEELFREEPEPEPEPEEELLSFNEVPEKVSESSGSFNGLIMFLAMSAITALGAYRMLVASPVDHHHGHEPQDQVHGASFVDVDTDAPPHQHTDGAEHGLLASEAAPEILSPSIEEVQDESWLKFIEREMGDAAKIRRLLPKHAWLSSDFGYRIDPFVKKWRFHHGFDIAMRSGAKVKAFLPGKVIAAGWHGHYGRAVFVEHPHGLVTIYGHLKKTLVDLGQTIEAHEVVGLAGMTGRSTGPHLHFEVRLGDKRIDPNVVPQFRQAVKKRRIKRSKRRS